MKKTVLFVSFVLSALHVHALKIDDFSAPAAGQNVTLSGAQPGDYLNTVTGLAGVVGGSRTLGIAVSAVGPFGLNGTFVEVQNGFFRHGWIAFGTAKASITWDGNGQGLGLDLSSMTGLGFQVGTALDGNPSVEIRLISSPGNYLVQTLVAHAGEGGTLAPAFFDLGGFTAVGAPVLSDINAIKMEFSGRNFVIDDIQITGVADVPDSSLGLFGFAPFAILICAHGMLQRKLRSVSKFSPSAVS